MHFKSKVGAIFIAMLSSKVFLFIVLISKEENLARVSTIVRIVSLEKYCNDYNKWTDIPTYFSFTAKYDDVR